MSDLSQKGGYILLGKIEVLQGDGVNGKDDVYEGMEGTEYLNKQTLISI